MKKIIFISILFSALIFPQKYALINGDVYTVTNGVMNGATVLINGERIEAVGTNVNITDDYESIDCSGMRIYPGLIDAGSRLGLQEIGSLQETRDYSEVGEFNPEVKAIAAVNPNSELIPVTRVNGITTVLAEPSSGLFPGQSAIINLSGYTPDQISVKNAAGLHLNFPSKGRASSFEKEKIEEREKKFKEKMDELNSIWEMAENYYRNSKSEKENFKRDFRFDPFVDLFEKKIHLIITVNNDLDILRALDWIKEKDIKIIFSGVSEGWRVADEIAKAKIPCLAGPVLTLPSRAEIKYDAPYTNIEILRKAGVKIAFRSGETENVRNLPYELATAISYGMPEEEALKAVTIYPSQIFEIEKDYGSIEPGKIANLVVIKGNIFEVRNSPAYIFIKGEQIPLVSRHTKLYEEFKNRK